MKQFFIVAVIAGALMVSSQSQARLVNTRAQCVAACGNAISDSCGWITRRGKFNRCRAKLYIQCKRFGTATMCPAPGAPVAPPPTTPTTQPAPVVTTTTTTVPYVPLTTTTLPPPVPGVLLQVQTPTETVTCNGFYAQKIWVNVCGTGGARGLNLNPYNFLFTQGSFSYDISGCHYDYRHTTACSSDISVNAPGCYTCSLIFDAAYTGAARNLFYEDYGTDGLFYQVDVDF